MRRSAKKEREREIKELTDEIILLKENDYGTKIEVLKRSIE